MKCLELKPLEEIKYIILRKHDGFVYYLNDRGIVESLEIKTATSDSIMKFLELNKGNINICEMFNPSYKFINFYPLMKQIVVSSDYEIEYENHNYNRYVTTVATVDKHSRYDSFKYLIGKIKNGMTYEEMKRVLEWTEDFYIKNNSYSNITYRDLKGIDKYITKICRPIIIRVPENPKENTFDIIKIEVNLTSDSDRYKYIKEHKQELLQQVLEKIQSCKFFQKYGVPINVLRCTRIHTVGINTIEIIFELKQL